MNAMFDPLDVTVVILAVALGITVVVLVVRHGFRSLNRFLDLCDAVCGDYYQYKKTESGFEPVLSSALSPEDSWCVSLWKRPSVLNEDRHLLEFQTHYKRTTRCQDFYFVRLEPREMAKGKGLRGDGSRPPQNTEEKVVLPSEHTWEFREDGSVLWTQRDKTTGAVYYWIKSPNNSGP